ncbi:hypothetical protein ASZ78_006039 [Callipepla squamata]|uniref:MAP7 domain-containing protein 3 n=1 Tax=Callipepla squamata TaxID=9009 RepID=A0A226NIG6_CALSU|nr:hypothetical protein ASZ78_006039 [Callipepla squamata]
MQRRVCLNVEWFFPTVAAAQAIADERRSQSGVSPIAVQTSINIRTATKPGIIIAHLIDGSTLRTEERQRLARERREEREKQQASKRSTSTANLKPTEAAMNKRLSSSAALLNSSDQTRRSQVSPLDSSVISRLLAPTQASLARSKSAATLSADGQDPSVSNTHNLSFSLSPSSFSPVLMLCTWFLFCLVKFLTFIESHLCPRSASASSINSPVPAPKVPVRSRSIDRLKSSVSSSDASSPDPTQKSETEKPSPGSGLRRPSSPSVSARRRSPSPANLVKRPPSPSTVRQRTRPPSPSISKQRPPSPTPVSKPAPIQRPPLTPGVINIAKKKTEAESKPKDKSTEGTGLEQGTTPALDRDAVAAGTKTKEESGSKAAAGTTTAEEAAKILAEKRRLAREQREREDQERIQRQEEERIREEEMAKRAAEEKARREEELRKQEEEKRQVYEEQQRQAEEERIRREQEEQEKLAELQHQKEEAEAKAQEEAERQRLERERIMQQNMQERLERKKLQNEGKSACEVMEGEDIEEEEELGIEKADQPGKLNGIDLPQEDKGETEGCVQTAHSLISAESGQRALRELKASEVFMNGSDLKSDEGSLLFTELKDSSHPAKEMVIDDSAKLGVNEADRTSGLTQNLNGKSDPWTAEELIDIGVHSKSTKLSLDSISAGNCNQNLNDAATIPSSPKLTYEEDGAVNSLTKHIDSSSASNFQGTFSNV